MRTADFDAVSDDGYFGTIGDPGLYVVPCLAHVVPVIEPGFAPWAPIDFAVYAAPASIPTGDPTRNPLDVAHGPIGALADVGYVPAGIFAPQSSTESFA